jgi:hypothetical protein
MHRRFALDGLAILVLEEGEHSVLRYPKAQNHETGSNHQSKNANSRYDHNEVSGFEFRESNASHSSNNVKREVKKMIYSDGFGDLYLEKPRRAI